MFSGKRSRTWPDPDEVVQRIANAEREDIRKRWHVIYLICRAYSKQKKLPTNKEIASSVGFTEQHIPNVRQAYLDDGAAGIEMEESRKRPRGGRKRKLTQTALKEMAVHLQAREEFGWRDVLDYASDVLKDPISDATARRYKKVLMSEFQQSQESSQSLTSLKPEKDTSKGADNPSQDSGETPKRRLKTKKQQPPPMQLTFRMYPPSFRNKTPHIVARVMRVVDDGAL